MKGTKGYFKLLKALDSELDEYVIEDDGKKYDVKEKRIYVPLIIFVNDGKIIGTHLSTVDTQESGYDELTKEEENYFQEARRIVKIDDYNPKGSKGKKIGVISLTIFLLLALLFCTIFALINIGSDKIQKNIFIYFTYYKTLNCSNFIFDNINIFFIFIYFIIFIFFKFK